MKNIHTNSKVAILGGGTAGWLSALYIKRNWPNADVTVIENPKFPPIIAGESGTTTFVTFLKHIGINIEEFVKTVNATPKLGGDFIDWNGVGTRFIHSLQTDYVPWLEEWSTHSQDHIESDLTLGTLFSTTKDYTSLNISRLKSFYLKSLLANNIELSRAFLATSFIKKNKVPFGAQSDIPVVPMWHFESRSGSYFFKEKGLERGISLIEGNYIGCTKDDRGNITSLNLEDGRNIEADWFFDCSGFARLLLVKETDAKIIDYTNFFPQRAVIAWWDSAKYDTVCSKAYAMKYGWSWNINLQHRSGNGYVYDPDHINKDQALEEIRNKFGKHIEPIAAFEYKPGITETLNQKNVFAVGLSNGFLEPLEANGVGIIIESLYAIGDYWNPFMREFPKAAQDRLNSRVYHISTDTSDFLALHYRGQRRDTEYWKSHAYDKFRTPDTLRAKLDDWQRFFKIGSGEPVYSGYSPTAWLMVQQGLGIGSYDNFKSELGENLLQMGLKIFQKTEDKYDTMAEPFLTIKDWVELQKKGV